VTKDVKRAIATSFGRERSWGCGFTWLGLCLFILRGFELYKFEVGFLALVDIHSVASGSVFASVLIIIA